MKTALKFILARAAEPSSWRGAIFLLSSLGVAISPSTGAAIIAAGLAVSGLIGVLVPDATPAAE